MNKKELALKRMQTWRKYRIPGCSNLHRVKQNAIFLSAANGKAHEMKKCEVCYELLKGGKKFITEAECNKPTTLPSGKKGHRKVDIIVLDTGEEIEIVDSSLTEYTKAEIKAGKDIRVVKA